jgi:hypothetical protein
MLTVREWCRDSWTWNCQLAATWQAAHTHAQTPCTWKLKAKIEISPVAILLFTVLDKNGVACLCNQHDARPLLRWSAGVVGWLFNDTVIGRGSWRFHGGDSSLGGGYPTFRRRFGPSSGWNLKTEAACCTETLVTTAKTWSWPRPSRPWLPWEVKKLSARDQRRAGLAKACCCCCYVTRQPWAHCCDTQLAP